MASGALQRGDLGPLFREAVLIGSGDTAPVALADGTPMTLADLKDVEEARRVEREITARAQCKVPARFRYTCKKDRLGGVWARKVMRGSHLAKRRGY